METKIQVKDISQE